MNAEQLYTIASTVVEDVTDSDIISKFAGLQNNLNTLASNPGDEKVQQSVETLKGELYASMDALGKKRWPAGVQQTIEQLGGGILISDEIREEIQNLFQTVSMTPVTVRDRINIIRSEIASFIDKLNALIAAFQALNIEEELLEPGEVELGVLIPREEIKNKLESFAIEVSNFDKIFKNFSVVAVGTREEFNLTYISASDLKFFIRPSAKTAALISATVTFILTSLNQVVDLKTKYDEITASGIDEKDLVGLKEGIHRKLEEDLEQFRNEMIEKYCAHKDKHDRHEDSNRLKIAIDHLAPRLERGYSLEVRVGPLPAPTDEADEETKNANIEERDLFETLQEDAQKLKRIVPTGPPVLSFPESKTLDITEGDK
ncbi:MAG: hypothetical protein HOO00_08145 [Rhodospirillaceae bacterium]|jgi:hypothetical protein|nr:hypothetical protein [Rhodospirillaceae bacterium]MBT5752803.1 hypothetical protein [Rhodospirillaceae bacterium]